MRARYYSPELRRFVNADILAGDITNAVTLNRYAYANGNPTANIDPYGLAILTTLAIMAIGGLVVAAIEATVSVAEQSITNGKVNWCEVASDAAWGFASGAVAASPLGVVGKVACDVVISCGSQLTEEYIYSDNKENGEWLNEVNWVEVGVNVAIDATFSAIDGPGLNYKNKIGSQIDNLTNIKTRQSKRKNIDVFKNRIIETDVQIKNAYVDVVIDSVLPDKTDIYHTIASKGADKIFPAVDTHSNRAK